MKYILVALALGADLCVGILLFYFVGYSIMYSGEKYISALLDGFAPHHAEHMAEYGAITNNG